MPPARPTAYPERNSLDPTPDAIVPVGDRAPSLTRLGVLVLKRAGLWGRLAGQNCLSSRLSSWPVEVQLLVMFSRSSWT